MRYIITGEYANGDTYAEACDDIEQLASTLYRIAGHDHSGAPDHYRIYSDSITIETEE